MDPATKPSTPNQGFWANFLGSLSRKEKVGYSMFALFLFGIFIIMPAGDLATQEWDKNSPTEWRECTVTKSEAYHSSSRRYHTYKIRIDTKDCGTFELEKGVTKENYEEKAGGITPGKYRLELAASAVKMESLKRFFHARIDIESIEPA